MRNEQNITAVKRLIEEAFGAGDLQVVDEIIDADCIEHQPGIEPPTAEGVKRAIQFLHTAFPDFQVTIQHMAAEDDLVWCHFIARGTHLGPFGHIPATSKGMIIDVIDIARCRDGRIVEHWGVADRFNQLKQLGLLPGRQDPIPRTLA